jgi:hypothetical protein
MSDLVKKKVEEGNVDRFTPPMFHPHPFNTSTAAYGVRLVPGDVTGASDFYASVSGRWKPAPCIGLTLQERDNDVVWVRLETIKTMRSLEPIMPNTFKEIVCQKEEK